MRSNGSPSRGPIETVSAGSQAKTENLPQLAAPLVLSRIAGQGRRATAATTASQEGRCRSGNMLKQGFGIHCACVSGKESSPLRRNSNRAARSVRPNRLIRPLIPDWATPQCPHSIERAESCASGRFIGITGLTPPGAGGTLQQHVDGAPGAVPDFDTRGRRQPPVHAGRGDPEHLPN
jgi:hypothetical protein